MNTGIAVPGNGAIINTSSTDNPCQISSSSILLHSCLLPKWKVLNNDNEDNRFVFLKPTNLIVRFQTDPSPVQYFCMHIYDIVHSMSTWNSVPSSKYTAWRMLVFKIDFATRSFPGNVLFKYSCIAVISRTWMCLTRIYYRSSRTMNSHFFFFFRSSYFGQVYVFIKLVKK